MFARARVLKSVAGGHDVLVMLGTYEDRDVALKIADHLLAEALSLISPYDKEKEK